MAQTARQKHEKLLKQVVQEPSRLKRWGILNNILDLQKEVFRPCATCGQDFLSKHYIDEIPEPNKTICPRCKGAT